MVGRTVRIGRLTVSAVADVGPEIDYGNFIWLAEAFPDVPDGAWDPYRAQFPSYFPVADHWADGRRSWLVQGPAATVLVDTGQGPGADRLHAALAALGVAPESVDLVFLTHLDRDHVGAALTSRGEPAFPQARYAVPRVEWAHAQNPRSRERYERSAAYLDDSVLPLGDLGVLELVDDGDRLADGASVVAAPGHTPGHCALLVASGDQRALLAADAFHHPAQITEHGWSSTYDDDQTSASTTRAQLAAMAASEGTIVSATHFPAPGFGRVVTQGGRTRWSPS